MSKEKNTNTDIIEKEYTTLNLGPTHPADVYKRQALKWE